MIEGRETGFHSQKLNIVHRHNLRNDEREEGGEASCAREGFKSKMQSQLCKCGINRREYAVTVTGCVRWIEGVRCIPSRYLPPFLMHPFSPFRLPRWLIPWILRRHVAVFFRLHGNPAD